MADPAQDTDMLNIHCDLVNTGLADGNEPDIIYSFSILVLRVSNNLTFSNP